MPATRTERTREEVAGFRAQARWELDEWGSHSPYVQTTRTAVLDAAAWVLGETATAPFTGREVAADDESIAAEMLAAEAVDERQAGPEDGDSVRAGRVGVFLSWYLCDPDTEPPL